MQTFAVNLASYQWGADLEIAKSLARGKKYET